MASNSFSNVKNLRFVIILGVGNPNTFAAGGPQANTITIQGMRATAYIDNAGADNMGTLKAQIYGLNLNDINSLTSAQWSYASGQLPNLIQVWAIDGQQETLIFNGNYINGWADFRAMPEVYFFIDAVVGYQGQMIAGDPTSLASDSTVSVLMNKIAGQMQLKFENSLTSEIAVKKGTYLGSTYMEQAKTLMQMFNFWMYVDPTTNPATLAICNRGTPRTTAVSPLISPTTGLIGYPTLNASGINFEAFFNPAIGFGNLVQVQSSIKKANGPFIATQVSHELTSVTPGGPWKTIVNAVPQYLFGRTAS